MNKRRFEELSRLSYEDFQKLDTETKAEYYDEMFGDEQTGPLTIFDRILNGTDIWKLRTRITLQRKCGIPMICIKSTTPHPCVMARGHQLIGHTCEHGKSVG